jgi:hypothetical protein
MLHSVSTGYDLGPGIAEKDFAAVLSCAAMLNTGNDVGNCRKCCYTCVANQADAWATIVWVGTDFLFQISSVDKMLTFHFVSYVLQKILFANKNDKCNVRKRKSFSSV